MKIGIVDDGVDEKNVFFAPTGMRIRRVPEGRSQWTTPKVIVARAFAGPGSGRPGRLPIDRKASFHGTHVAGHRRRPAGTSSPGGPDHPPVATSQASRPRLGRELPRLQRPDAGGYIANTPEIVAAFEAAVRDGMDVINFSGGGAGDRSGERRDDRGGQQRRRRRRRSGDLGRQRTRRLRARQHRLAGNRAGRDHGRQPRRTSTSSRLRSRAGRTGAGRPCATCRSERRFRCARSAAGTRATRRSSTSARSAEPTGGPSTPALRRLAPERARHDATAQLD